MPERQCAGCTKQEEWGCTAVRWRTPDKDEPDGPENWLRPAALPVTIEGEELWGCPRQSLHQHPRDWGQLLLFYGLYSKGHLPDRGAVVDQSNVLMEAFRVLDDANRECDNELEEKRAAQANRKGRRGKLKGRG